jgi:hypothetical protein
MARKKSSKNAGREKRDASDLINISGEHLPYELMMLHFCSNGYRSRLKQLLAPNIDDKDWTKINNALIDSFAVHIRVLLVFFFGDKQHKDDALASQFFAQDYDWTNARNEILSASEYIRIKDRVNTQAAHLSYGRLAFTPENKDWSEDGDKAYDAIMNALEVFLAEAKPEYLSDQLRALGKSLLTERGDTLSSSPTT